MKCEEVRGFLELKRDGTLQGVELDALLKHLESCPACEEFDRSVPILESLVSDAFGTTESSTLETRIKDALVAEPAASPAPAGRLLRFGWIAAAAALFVICASIFKGDRSGKVLLGTLEGNATQIQDGQRYTAKDETVIGVGTLSRALVTKGSAFTMEDGRLQVLAGSCYVLGMKGAGRRHPRVKAHEMEAELVGETHAFLHVPGVAMPEISWQERLSEALFTSALAEKPAAAGRSGTDEAFIIVFAGKMILSDGSIPMLLPAGTILFAGDVDKGPVDLGEFIEGAERALKKVGAPAPGLSARIALYREVIEGYKAALARENLVKIGDAGHEEALERRRLIEEVKASHEKRLKGFLQQEAAVAETRQTRTRLEQVKAAEDKYAEAMASLTSI